MGGLGRSGFLGRNPPLDPSRSGSDDWDPSPTHWRCQSGHDGSVPIELISFVESSGILDTSICMVHGAQGRLCIEILPKHNSRSRLSQ